jgi:hypothetical protein
MNNVKTDKIHYLKTTKHKENTNLLHAPQMKKISIKH